MTTGCQALAIRKRVPARIGPDIRRESLEPWAWRGCHPLGETSTDDFDGGPAHRERGFAHGDEKHAASAKRDALAADVNDSTPQAQHSAHGFRRIDGLQRRPPEEAEVFLVICEARDGAAHPRT